MTRIFLSILLLSTGLALLGCGGNGASKFAPQPLPNIAGAWEITAVPNVNNGTSTGIEVALKEGQVFSNSAGGYVPNGQVSASGTQISFVGINTAGFVLTGTANCPVPGPDTNGNNLAGSLSGIGGPFNFSYTENGNDFNVTATLSSDGTNFLGTYASQPGSNCTDSGTITGVIVPKLSGTYLGQLCQPLDGPCQAPTKDSATVTLSQSGTTLTVSMVLTGADNTTFTVSGPVAGNAFSVQGTFQGQAVAYFGYYQALFDSTDGLFDIRNIYLVNTAAPSQLAGQLTIPITQ